MIWSRLCLLLVCLLRLCHHTGGEVQSARLLTERRCKRRHWHRSGQKHTKARSCSEIHSNAQVISSDISGRLTGFVYQCLEVPEDDSRTPLQAASLQ